MRSPAVQDALRRVPVALKDQIKQNLEQLEEQDIPGACGTCHHANWMDKFYGWSCKTEWTAQNLFEPEELQQSG